MKPIYQPKGAAKEYGDYALNIYTCIGNDYDAFLDKAVKIKYCPMCGRRLED